MKIAEGIPQTPPRQPGLSLEGGKDYALCQIVIGPPDDPIKGECLILGICGLCGIRFRYGLVSSDRSQWLSALAAKYGERFCTHLVKLEKKVRSDRSTGHTHIYPVERSAR